MVETTKTRLGEQGKVPLHLRASIPQRRVMARVHRVLAIARLRKLVREALNFETDYRLGY